MLDPEAGDVPRRVVVNSDNADGRAGSRLRIVVLLAR
jgi:hypothetical protein